MRVFDSLLFINRTSSSSFRRTKNEVDRSDAMGLQQCRCHTLALCYVHIVQQHPTQTELNEMKRTKHSPKLDNSLSKKTHTEKQREKEINVLFAVSFVVGSVSFCSSIAGLAFIHHFIFVRRALLPFLPLFRFGVLSGKYLQHICCHRFSHTPLSLSALHADTVPFIQIVFFSTFLVLLLNIVL